jgi:hypothetical protein
MKIKAFAIAEDDAGNVRLDLTVQDANKQNTWAINLPCSGDGELSGDALASGLNTLARNIMERERG